MARTNATRSGFTKLPDRGGNWSRTACNGPSMWQNRLPDISAVYVSSACGDHSRKFPSLLAGAEQDTATARVPRLIACITVWRFCVDYKAACWEVRRDLCTQAVGCSCYKGAAISAQAETRGDPVDHKTLLDANANNPQQEKCNRYLDCRFRST